MNRISHAFARIVSKLVNRRLRFESRRDGQLGVGRDVEGLHHVEFAGNNAVGRGTIFANSVKVGYGSTIGANNYLNGPISIGNYCQLAPSVGIYGKDHPTTYPTTYVNQRMFNGRLAEHANTAEVQVGHDVWIGHGAVLLRGVTVGDGAVIGAGAVVTTSIPAYGIAVGSPARVIKYRFTPEVIDLFQRLKWWSLPGERLEQLEGLFNTDFAREPERGAELLRDALRRVGGM